ncbi:protein LNK3-like [Telopea speciosissima]|uniref:protein LNK3-like n=1 Tax=Telopea speciosissima TaxID=54955 RepID=UPI001CC4F637|nr:protein LNK3-like [Telopea speciosissima]
MILDVCCSGKVAFVDTDLNAFMIFLIKDLLFSFLGKYLQILKKDQMDCYVGVEADIVVVPKRQQLSFRFPSPDYCLQWEVANSENFWSANEKCVSATNVTNGEGSCDEVKVQTSIHGESSTDSSWCEELPFFDQSPANPEASLDMIRPLGNEPDYPLDDTVDQPDDIFLRSILETSPGMENPYKPVSMHPLLDRSMMPSENILTDMIAELQSISMNVSTTNISKNLSIHTPSSGDWERVENTPHFMPFDSGEMKDCSMTKEPVVPCLIPAELNSPHKVDRHLSAGGSLEESVLQELEVAMAQLTKSIRLCFRDALYRLAKGSEQSHIVSQARSGEITQEKHSLSTVHYKTPRFGRVNPTDYQTNAIDWTIAKLMFEKMDCDTHGISSAASVNLSKETVMTDASPNYGLNRTPVPLYPRCSLLPHDAGVSMLGGENNIMIDF